MSQGCVAKVGSVQGHDASSSEGRPLLANECGEPVIPGQQLCGVHVKTVCHVCHQSLMNVSMEFKCNAEHVHYRHQTCQPPAHCPSGATPARWNPCAWFSGRQDGTVVTPPWADVSSAQKLLAEMLQVQYAKTKKFDQASVQFTNDTAIAVLKAVCGNNGEKLKNYHGLDRECITAVPGQRLPDQPVTTQPVAQDTNNGYFNALALYHKMSTQVILHMKWLLVHVASEQGKTFTMQDDDNVYGLLLRMYEATLNIPADARRYLADYDKLFDPLPQESIATLKTKLNMDFTDSNSLSTKQHWLIKLIAEHSTPRKGMMANIFERPTRRNIACGSCAGLGFIGGGAHIGVIMQQAFNLNSQAGIPMATPAVWQTKGAEVAIVWFSWIVIFIALFGVAWVAYWYGPAIVDFVQRTCCGCCSGTGESTH
tara:strand:+ start:96030 stop:97304 length:1275 start_codon:yes stop_codon:yes gene_type:complete